MLIYWSVNIVGNPDSNVILGYVFDFLEYLALMLWRDAKKM